MSFKCPSHVDLRAFAQGTHHLSPAMCANLAEAAVVCLTQQGHVSDIPMDVDGQEVTVVCGTPDTRAGASHADRQEATEEGAVALAITLVRDGTEFDVIQRSWKGTGFDYFLAHAGSNPPFDRAACLEVSRIFDEDDLTMARRIKQKQQQIDAGDGALPGFVVVVGFRQPRAAVRSVP